MRNRPPVRVQPALRRGWKALALARH